MLKYSAAHLSLPAAAGIPGAQGLQEFVQPKQLQQAHGVLLSPTTPEAQFMQWPFYGSGSPHYSDRCARMVVLPAAAHLTASPSLPLVPMLITETVDYPDRRFVFTSHDQSRRDLEKQVKQAASMAQATQEFAMVAANQLGTGNCSQATRWIPQEFNTFPSPQNSGWRSQVFPYGDQPTALVQTHMLPSNPAATSPLSRSSSVCHPWGDAARISKPSQEEFKRLLKTILRNKDSERMVLQTDTAGLMSEWLDWANGDCKTHKEVEDAFRNMSSAEWKKLRVRILSRLRKRRWRARKKAEVLAGVERARLEAEDRLRRDRNRKQEQRAKRNGKGKDAMICAATESTSHHRHDCVDLPEAFTTPRDEEYQNPQTTEPKTFSHSTSPSVLRPLIASDSGPCAGAESEKDSN